MVNVQPIRIRPANRNGIFTAAAMDIGQSAGCFQLILTGASIHHIPGLGCDYIVSLTGIIQPRFCIGRTFQSPQIDRVIFCRACIQTEEAVAFVGLPNPAIPCHVFVTTGITRIGFTLGSDTKIAILCINRTVPIKIILQTDRTQYSPITGRIRIIITQNQVLTVFCIGHRIISAVVRKKTKIKGRISVYAIYFHFPGFRGRSCIFPVIVQNYISVRKGFGTAGNNRITRNQMIHYIIKCNRFNGIFFVILYNYLASGPGTIFIILNT